MDTKYELMGKLKKKNTREWRERVEKHIQHIRLLTRVVCLQETSKVNILSCTYLVFIYAKKGKEGLKFNGTAMK